MTYWLICLHLLFFMAYSSPAFALDNTNQQTWELKKDEDGIKVYTRSIENSKLKTFRVESIVQTSIDSLLLFLLNFDDYQNWMVDCSESKTLLKEKNNYVYVCRFTFPWPFMDRIAVSDVRIEYLKNGTVRAFSSPSDIKYQKTNTLLLENFKSSYFLTPLANKSVKFSMSGVYDPGGNLPAWISNYFIVEGPYGTLRVIKQKLEPK